MKCIKECDYVDVNRKLQCTNLNFFSHLVSSLYNYENITAISTVRKSEEQTIRIDIIANDNRTWVNTIARNSDSILDEALGRCEFGCKDILAVADEFLAVSEQMNFFQPPTVVFDFLHPINEELELALEQKGIVIGRKFHKLETQSNRECTKLNIDITTLIAYVSELSNGGAHHKFNEILLEKQAATERKEAIKPILDSLFEGKILICCETAVKSFDEIIHLLAGPNEKSRAEELKKRLTILPDVDFPENIIKLDLSAQIKERSRKIFAFGVFHEAVTVTSNNGFKRSAKMQNLNIPTFVHGARALTENKQVE